MINKELTELLADLPISCSGVADILDLHSLGAKYSKALSLGISYEPDFKVYKENLYDDLLKRVSVKTDDITDKAAAFFASRNIEYLVVPQGGQDSKTLLALFPHKLAATRAGLGWIGKNSLLITDEYGPRLRLSTILFNADVPCSTPITVDRCGQCSICVEACPYDCIRNVNWHPGLERKQLFNAHKCNAERESFRPEIGHKHQCGYCLLACPRGN
ncbi:MAG: epoxyqueuosine reductase [Proteobacteria bacterium]|nr:epoxyqueuosine reductase [Pseudomonadota bacterium]